MDIDRVREAWSAVRTLAEHDNATMSARHACMACERAVSADGVGLSLSRGSTLSEPVHATGVAADVEELQFSIGEGPCLDALAERAPVLVTDLADGENGRRWPAFAPAAVRYGVRSAFSFPLLMGAIRVGVLDLYRLRPQPLTKDEVADVLVYADVAMLLAMRSAQSAQTERHDIVGTALDERRAEVHQASGMVSVQLGITVDNALARLRAYAYASDLRLIDVARDVVARRLRFAPDEMGDTSSTSGDPDKEQT